MKRIAYFIKIIGLVLFFIVIYKVGWEETFESLKRVPLIHGFIALLILWIAFFLKSIRWLLISNAYEINIKFYEAFRVFFIGLFLANITPGRLGDFGRLFYIKNYLPSRKVGLGSLVMDRLFDLVCLLLFVAVALFYFQLRFDLLKVPSSFESFTYWVLIFGGISILLFLIRKKIIKIIKPWRQAFNSHNLNFVKSFSCFLLTTFSMVLIYGVFNYTAWAMKIQIDPIGLFLGSFILGVLSLLPITVLGIGVRETSLILIFKLYGLPASEAIALSLIVFMLHIASFLPGAIWFYLSPIELKDIKRAKNDSSI